MNNKSETSNPRMSKGNLCCQEYIVGFTPVDDILYIDKDEPNADITGVKYSKHKAGDNRPKEAGSDDQFRVTMIIKGGPWKQQMWLHGQDRETIKLTKEGDYIAWEPGYCHTWEAIGDTTMLTISFRRRDTDV